MKKRFMIDISLRVIEFSHGPSAARSASIATRSAAGRTCIAWRIAHLDGVAAFHVFTYVSVSARGESAVDTVVGVDHVAIIAILYTCPYMQVAAPGGYATDTAVDVAQVAVIANLDTNPDVAITAHCVHAADTVVGVAQVAIITRFVAAPFESIAAERKATCSIGTAGADVASVVIVVITFLDPCPEIAITAPGEYAADAAVVVVVVAVVAIFVSRPYKPVATGRMAAHATGTAGTVIIIVVIAVLAALTRDRVDIAVATRRVGAIGVTGRGIAAMVAFLTYIQHTIPTSFQSQAVSATAIIGYGVAIVASFSAFLDAVAAFMLEAAVPATSVVATDVAVIALFTVLGLTVAATIGNAHRLSARTLPARRAGPIPALDRARAR
jgi:hypothetical protein